MAHPPSRQLNPPLGFLFWLRDEIYGLAAQMDESTRTSYLTRGFPSARILGVARDWLGDGAPM